jgi:hypothetical protein
VALWVFAGLLVMSDPVPRGGVGIEVSFGNMVSQASASSYRTSERGPAFVMVRRAALISPKTATYSLDFGEFGN